MDEQAPQGIPAPLPETPPALAATDQAPAATPPAQPALPRVWVAYTQQPETPTPVEAGGLYWHDRTLFPVAADIAAQLVTQPGFAIVERDAPPPALAPRNP